MSKAKHTTWTAERCRCGNDGCRSWIVNPICTLQGAFSEKDHALLCAAAPDLLEALKTILDGGIADPAQVAKAHTAIAKAEGR